MDNHNLKKKLLAVVLTAVMLIGCAGSVFAYSLTKADKAALKNAPVKFIGSVDEDDGVKGVKISATASSTVDAMEYFHMQYPKATVKYVFGLSGFVDDDKGTLIRVADAGINYKSKACIYEYDKKTGKWTDIGMGKGSGYFTFNAKSKGPFLVTSNNTKKAKIKTFKFDKSSLQLKVGEKKQLTLKVSSAFKNGKVKWTSSNKNIASVSSSGVVRLKKAGSATITANLWGTTTSCSVSEKKVKKITIKNVKKEYLELAPGAQKQIEYTVSPSDAYNKKLTWTSSNPDVISVSSKGLVKVRKGASTAGNASAIITATAKDGGYASAAFAVVVVPKK